jgi:hypothetical protein
METLTPSQLAIGLDRIASKREGFTKLGEGYSFGVTSRPENPKELTPEQRREQTVWGITKWDESKLGTEPTMEEIEAEANKTKVPDSLTRRQFHLAALSMGITKETILQAIEGIEDETQRAYAKADYEEASVFKRDWSLLVQMAHTLSLTDDQIDQAFIQGAKL